VSEPSYSDRKRPVLLSLLYKHVCSLLLTQVSTFLVSRALGLAIVLVLAVSHTFLSVLYLFDLISHLGSCLTCAFHASMVFPVFAPISQNQLCRTYCYRRTTSVHRPL
jgi:hypothetical protein